MSRFSAFRNEIKWSIVVVVLAGLAVVALWPRDSEVAAPQPERPASPAAPSPSADPAELAGLRKDTGLEPCPESPAGTPPDQLAGVAGTCLADGSAVDMAAAAGRPTLINVWASWCVPCRSELPALQAYSEQPGALPVLGVQVLSDEAGGLELLNDLGVRFPSVFDADNRIRAALRVPNVLPMSFVVTPAGEVRRVDPPIAFSSPEDVRQAVARTLGADGG